MSLKDRYAESMKIIEQERKTKKKEQIDELIYGIDDVISSMRDVHYDPRIEKMIHQLEIMKIDLTEMVGEEE